MTENTLFQQMLLKSLNETNNEIINSVEKICLITQDKLEADHITLPNCKHTFNYKSIFQEVVKQKIQYNSLETQKLGSWQMKCPYCRNTVEGILPYRDNNSKTRYVNWPWEHSFIKNYCKYCFVSGKKKGKTCNKICENGYCTSHLKIINNRKKKQEEKEKKKEENKNDLTKMTVKELKKYCKIHGIKKYSTLRKKQILELINKYWWKEHSKKQAQQGVQLYNQIVTI